MCSYNWGNYDPHLFIFQSLSSGTISRKSDEPVRENFKNVDFKP